ncbi:expressed unknown protein [Ectocarpus siliculosus]|uniref:Uncharacterized protein n=1 Tax=Ectocarpus siliculosus TaxID=2880 RepID=D7FMV0_ECTSI|nr:expressed unknown protein [Ectocarpus siliculosus]|eukprot:CBJ30014.1 expressed unknown protein [Ectocarpus siliculosus]
MTDDHVRRHGGGSGRLALSCTALRANEGAGPSVSKALGLLCLLAASIVPSVGQQMDPAQMQRQIQQQMGGSPGGGGGAPPPNRIAQMLSAVGAGGASAARCAREHPRAAVAATAGAATALWVGKETRRSGLLVCSSPRISLFRPSDAYLSRVLEAAAEAPVASPLRGVILSPLQDPQGEEEQEEGQRDSSASSPSAEGGSKKRRGSGRRRVGDGGISSSNSSSSSRLREGEEEAGGAAEIRATLGIMKSGAGQGTYMHEATHGKGVKSVCAGVRVGKGLGIYHKFAQGLGKLDVFDGRSDCELMAAESSSEDVGSTLGLLTRPALGTWSLSPLRVVLKRERTLAVPRSDDDGHGAGGRRGRRTGSSGSSSSRREIQKRSSRRRQGRSSSSNRSSSRSSGDSGRRRKGKGSSRAGKEEEEDEGEETERHHRQYTLALSAVEGAGWSGTWVFRVTLDAETEEVWFETKLSQRKGSFGTTAGGDQLVRVTRVNQDMLARANRHSAVLRAREEQFTRVSSLARSRAKDAKDLARDRILHPDKYKRVHRYMREDSHTTGGASARPARWGEERRRNDIRLK